jgi:Ca-activated chloride channel homolog
MEFQRLWLIYPVLVVIVALIGLIFYTYKLDSKRRNLLMPAILQERIGLINRPWFSIIRRIPVLLGIALLGLAIARPMGNPTDEEAQGMGMDVYVLLDLSSSMKAMDLEPDRLTVAKQAIYKLVSKLEYDRVGLIVFAGEAFIYCPLTTDHEAFLTFLKRLSTDTVQKQGTMIGEAIELAVDHFRGEDERGRAIILLTDGEDQGSDPIAAADYAKEKGIIIYTVGLGDPDGAPIPDARDVFGRITWKEYKGEQVKTKLDEKTLEQIAFNTGGLYYRGSTNEDLSKVVKQLSTLDKRVISTLRHTRKSDIFQWFLLPAILLLAFDSWLTRWLSPKAEPVLWKLAREEKG